jgi:DNA-damage-inducible protein D
MLQLPIGSRAGIKSVLHDPRVRQVIHEGQTLFCAPDVVAVLSDGEQPIDAWEQLGAAHPQIVERIVMVAPSGDMLDLEGVLRLIQAMADTSPRIRRLKNQIAAAARDCFDEADDPEAALLRTRHAYEQQGRSRQWIDQRMRSVSARHELTSEWYRRGVRDGEQFRALTNEMMANAFGMDVESYRRYKGLFRTTGQNLRDHMTELELSLTALAETAAAELHRTRRSSGFDALLMDAKDSGKLIAQTRRAIEQQLGRSVVSAVNNLSDAHPRAPHRPRERREHDLAA